MRILFVSRCLPLPRVLGDRLILFHLLAGLRAQGHHCEVLALMKPEDDPALVEACVPLADQLESFPEHFPSPSEYLLRLLAPFPSRAAACWQPDLWNAIVRRLAGGGVDVVHFLGGIQVYEHRDAALGWPRLIHPYECYSWWLSRAIDEAGSIRERGPLLLKRSVARRFEKRIFCGFDRVLLNAGQDERALRALAPGLPTSVIPQGVEVPEGIVQIAARDALNMVFVGNLSYSPNVRAAVRLVKEILPRVRERIPDATVSLVGTDPVRPVRRLASEQVEVTGTVPDVLPWLARARVFVSPLALGAGMKNKVLEAMAAGAPVVATPVSCDGIDLRDGEHALLAVSSEDLAEAACRVLTDDACAAALSRAARRLVEERYRWPTVIARYEALYADLLTARHRVAGP